MAIDPSMEAVTTAQPWATAKKGATAGGAPATPFAEVLSGTASPEPVKATTAAEILRLKMMSSAMALGDDEHRGAGNSMGVQAVLDKFLEQLPKSAAAGTPPGAGAGTVDAGAAGAAGAVDAAPPLAEAAGSAPLSLEGIIQKAASRYGVDGGLIKAVIKAESDFNPRAVSPVGAKGLMQLMPSTARGLGVTDAFDPEQNVMAGTRFLKDMLNRYGNVDEALAAYNWGPANVDRHGTDRLPRETRAYLGRVKNLYSQYVA